MIIKAKTVVPGVVRGEAIVSRMPISFTGGVDPKTGIVRERGHDLEGKSIAGKVLLFPIGKGSTTGSWQFYATYKRGNAPIGIINLKSEGVVAVSAVITGTPMVHLPEQDPFEYIKDGDIVTVNGDEGFLKVEPRDAVQETEG